MGVLHAKSRKVKAEDFVGKTVLAVNPDAVNVVSFTFTDGTSVELWAETGPDGIPVIEVDPKAKKGK